MRALIALVLCLAADTGWAAEPVWIFSSHDVGGYAKIEQAGKRGWLVVTVGIGHEPTDHSGDDFSFYSNRGHGVIVRLNNGYGADGTLPYQAQYQNFATRCANYVAATQGADIFIIGNETNLAREWPGNNNGDPTTGEAITVARYVDCYNRCYDAIKAVRQTAQVMPSPSGTWAPPLDGVYGPNRGIEGFLDYWVNILNGIGASKIDAIGLHCYTHGCDPGLVIDSSKMGPPYQDIYYNFRVYRNYMAAIPALMRAKPAYITECDENTECADGGAQPKHTWLNSNNGWVKAIYSEINTWNQNAANQKIRCVTLFRWDDVPEGEWGFGFSNRSGAVNDWLEAMANDYRWNATPPGTISGIVRDVYNNPINLAAVATSTGGYSALTGPTGAYSMSVAPGTYTVTASKAGYCAQSVTGRSVVSGQTTTVNFTLVPSANLITNGGFENGFSGGVGSGWSTWTGSWSNSITWADSTDVFHNGAHAQRWGRSDAKAVHGGICRSVAVTTGSQYDLGAYLRFTSTDPSAWIELGYDLTGQTGDGEAATISYTKYESGGQGAWIAASKSFTAAGPAVSIFAKFGHTDQIGSGPCWAWVDDITLAESVGAITGYVRDAGGTAVGAATVSAGPGGHSTTSGADGYYVLTGLPAGSYSVTASKTGYKSQASPKSVTAGQVAALDFTLNLLKNLTRISQAKLERDGTWVSIPGVVCSRMSGQYLVFVQDSDRSCGIRVMAGSGSIPTLTPGQRCTVQGRLASGSNVRRITDVSVVAGALGSVAPLAMRGSAVGGSDFFYDAGPPAAGQMGTSWSNGPNNTGLLVKTWGRVLDTPSGGIIHLFDGSVAGGIPVKLSSGITAPAQGSYVSITGIPELDSLLVVSASDIRGL